MPDIPSFQPGEFIDAPTLNDLIDRSNRAATGEGVVSNSTGIAMITRRQAAGEAQVVAGASFAIITSRAGTAPPWRYSASQATMDIDGAWSAVGGGAAYSNVFNLEEQGTGGQWVNPLNNGDVVVIYPAPDPEVVAFVCHRGHYRGTY